VLAVVALVAAVGAGVALSRVERSAPALPTAVASMPAETLTASVTHWSRVRDLLGGRGADAGVLDRAYDTDASAVSALGTMVPLMDRLYGWSVLDVDWEALAQSRQGAAIVLQMPAGVELGMVRERLGELGYREPFEPAGVWRGGTDLVARLATPTTPLTPLLAHAVVLDDSRRVVFSDSPVYAASAARVSQGTAESLGQQEPVAAVADQLDDALAGVVHVGERACHVMGFRGASAAEAAFAAQRVRSVGGIGRFAAVGVGMEAGDTSGRPGTGLRRPPLVVAMHFDGHLGAGAAADEARRRARLAVGEAPGQGGTYQSRFSVESAGQRGGDVVLRLRPREAGAQLLSDLNPGQLLFASCG
jgi:hypothetical protein